MGRARSLLCLIFNLHPIDDFHRIRELIEVHFHLHNEPSTLEANISYDEHQHFDLVQQVRRAEMLLG